MKRFLTVVAACAIALASAASFAQVAGTVQAQTPMTRDIGATQKLSAQAAATVTSADQSGFNVRAIVCVFRQSTFGGSPSTTFKIQGKDAASAQYYDIITSSAVTSSTSATPLASGLGLPNSSNLSQGFPVPRTWRTSVTVAGSSTPLVTATVGCSVQ